MILTIQTGNGWPQREKVKYNKIRRKRMLRKLNKI